MTDPVMLLSQAHGEGRVTYRALRAAGFFTLDSVAESQPGILAERAHLSARSARRLKSGAEEMLGQGVSSNHTHAAPRSRVRRAALRISAKPLFSDGVIAEEALLLLGDPLRAVADHACVGPPAEEAEVISVEALPPAPPREGCIPASDPPRADRISWAFG